MILNCNHFLSKAICLLLFLQLLPLETVAQDDWQKGYVVTNAGDTLKGLVRDRNTGTFGELYTKIQIKVNGKGKKRFKANKIQGYAWGGARFVTLYTVSNSRGFKTETIVSPNGQPEFYRVITEGPLSLYHKEFTDQDNSFIDFVPYFKRESSSRLVRATQGVFGLKKKLLADFFADQPDLVRQINDGTLKTPQDVVAAYRP